MTITTVIIIIVCKLVLKFFLTLDLQVLRNNSIILTGIKNKKVGKTVFTPIAFFPTFRIKYPILNFAEIKQFLYQIERNVETLGGKLSAD